MTFHFLINDNHVHDAWVFAGIMMRQSQVLQLNRNPKAVMIDSSAYEMQMRLKLWTLILYQDISVAMFLKLSPSSIQTDIDHESFKILKQQCEELPLPPSPLSTVPMLSQEIQSRDLDFLHCVWTLAVFLQTNICVPRSLGQSICKSHKHKAKLVEDFQALWQSFPPPYDSRSPERFINDDTRLAKQFIFLANGFYHPLMLITSDENEEQEVYMDVYGTLDAAHEALIPFFAMHEMFGSEVNGFWAMQHRSFEVAVSFQDTEIADGRGTADFGAHS